MSQPQARGVGAQADAAVAASGVGRLAPLGAGEATRDPAVTAFLHRCGAGRVDGTAGLPPDFGLVRAQGGQGR